MQIDGLARDTLAGASCPANGCLALIEEMKRSDTELHTA